MPNRAVTDWALPDVRDVRHDIDRLALEKARLLRTYLDLDLREGKRRPECEYATSRLLIPMIRVRELTFSL